jgi:hypothetical protein
MNSKTIVGMICSVALVIFTLAYAQPTGVSPDPKAGAEMTGTIKEYTAGGSWFWKRSPRANPSSSS